MVYSNNDLCITSFDRFDISKYTWEKDAIIVRTSLNQKSIEKFSSTLRTRDYEKHWFKCIKEHVYVCENVEPCVTCIKEERKNENMKIQDELLNQHNSHLRENLERPLKVTDYRAMGRGRGRGGRGRGRFRGRW